MITRLLSGIDMSEEWFDACLEEKVERFANDEAGRRAFLERARSFGKSQIHVAIEHTGGCETPLALLCHEAGFSVSLLDGLRVARYRESLGRARAKNDVQDARLITRFLKERNPALWSPRPEEYRVLTDLVRHRADLVETRKAWKSRGRKPTTDELVAAQRDALVQVLDAQIEELNRRIARHVEAHENLAQDVALLDSLPGIDKVSATRILAEMGDVSAYATPRQLALAAGVAPVECQSGKSRAKGKLVPYGNRELRNALYMPAMVAIRVGSPLADFAERLRGYGGKSNKTILVAAMRKLAHVIHGVLASRKPYDPELMRKHMSKGT